MDNLLQVMERSSRDHSVYYTIPGDSAHYIVADEIVSHYYAHLFASAPDLLEACKASLSELDRDEDAGSDRVYRMLRAAIAKAEGNAP